MDWLQPLVLLMLAWLITWGSWVTTKLFGSISRKEYKEDREKFFQKLDDIQHEMSSLNTNVAILNDRARK